jgi:hypothetical protein
MIQTVPFCDDDGFIHLFLCLTKVSGVYTICTCLGAGAGAEAGAGAGAGAEAGAEVTVIFCFGVVSHLYVNPTITHTMKNNTKAIPILDKIFFQNVCNGLPIFLNTFLTSAFVIL